VANVSCNPVVLIVWDLLVFPFYSFTWWLVVNCCPLLSFRKETHSINHGSLLLAWSSSQRQVSRDSWTANSKEDAPAHPGEIVTVRSLCEAFASSKMTKAGGCAMFARFNVGAFLLSEIHQIIYGKSTKKWAEHIRVFPSGELQGTFQTTDASGMVGKPWELVIQ